MFNKNFKSLSQILTYIDENLGFKKFMQYTLFILFIIAVFNYKTIIKDTIEISNEITKAEHAKRLLLRDELLESLNPLLIELRAEVGADRVLYFEYHNSKENLVGIPFKYMDLVLPVRRYGVPDFDITKYRDIPSGFITNLYVDLRDNDIVIDKGDSPKFSERYAGIGDFMNEKDGSHQRCYLNIPGIDTPVGMITLEWMSDNPKKDWTRIEQIVLAYIPRINALILSKTKE